MSNRMDFGKVRFSNVEDNKALDLVSGNNGSMSPGLKGKALRRQKSISGPGGVSVKNIDETAQQEIEANFEEVNLSMADAYPRR